MNPKDKAKLVNAWIELQKSENGSSRYNELFWSFSQLWDLIQDDPDTGFELILSILNADKSTTIKAVLAAGPLEDLLVYHGPVFIERIENEAERNPEFKNLLGGVWKNRIADEVWMRVQARWDRSGWDKMPE